MRTSEPAKGEPRLETLGVLQAELWAPAFVFPLAWEKLATGRQGSARILEWGPSAPRPVLDCTQAGGLCLLAEGTFAMPMLLQESAFLVRMPLGMPVLHEL